jgi:diketogulonate reductase-like aldo/keto reductase
MGLDYVDLWLAHWPFSLKAISREAPLNATVSPEDSHEDGRMLEENGKPFID